MEKWDKNKKRMIDVGEDFETFFNKFKALCEVYDVSISHEDKHGSFIFERYKSENMEWLEEAMVSFED